MAIILNDRRFSSLPADISNENGGLKKPIFKTVNRKVLFAEIGVGDVFRDLLTAKLCVRIVPCHNSHPHKDTLYYAKTVSGEWHPEEFGVNDDAELEKLMARSVILVSKKL